MRIHNHRDSDLSPVLFASQGSRISVGSGALYPPYHCRGSNGLEGYSPRLLPLLSGDVQCTSSSLQLFFSIREHHVQVPIPSSLDHLHYTSNEGKHEIHYERVMVKCGAHTILCPSLNAPVSHTTSNWLVGSSSAVCA